MAQTYDTFWQQRYARRLAELIAMQADALCAGQMKRDEYKLAAGTIRGLNMALEAIDEVTAEIRKAEQGSK